MKDGKERGTAENIKKSSEKMGFEKLIQNEKFKRGIIIAGLLGIAIIFISSFFDGGEQGETGQIYTETIDSSQTTDLFKQKTEQELAEIISSIEGAGTTKVMVTVDSTSEYVYATDDKSSIQEDTDRSDGAITEKSDINSEKSYITVKLSDGTEQAIVLKQIEPQVRGVLVVCEGGGDPVISGRVLESVTKSLGLSSTKVFIAPLDESAQAIAQMQETQEDTNQ